MIFNSVSRREGVAAASSFVGCTATELRMDEGVERERTGPPAGRIKPPPLLTSRIRERGLEIALADFISGQIILRGSVLPFVPSPALGPRSRRHYLCLPST